MGLTLGWGCASKVVKWGTCIRLCVCVFVRMCVCVCASASKDIPWACACLEHRRTVGHGECGRVPNWAMVETRTQPTGPWQRRIRYQMHTFPVSHHGPLIWHRLGISRTRFSPRPPHVAQAWHFTHTFLTTAPSCGTGLAFHAHVSHHGPLMWHRLGISRTRFSPPPPHDTGLAFHAHVHMYTAAQTRPATAVNGKG